MSAFGHERLFRSPGSPYGDGGGGRVLNVAERASGASDFINKFNSYLVNVNERGVDPIEERLFKGARRVKLPDVVVREYCGGISGLYKEMLVIPSINTCGRLQQKETGEWTLISEPGLKAVMGVDLRGIIPDLTDALWIQSAHASDTSKVDSWMNIQVIPANQLDMPHPDQYGKNDVFVSNFRPKMLVLRVIDHEILGYPGKYKTILARYMVDVPENFSQLFPPLISETPPNIQLPEAGRLADELVFKPSSLEEIKPVKAQTSPVDQDIAKQMAKLYGIPSWTPPRLVAENYTPPGREGRTRYSGSVERITGEERKKARKKGKESERKTSKLVRDRRDYNAALRRGGPKRGW